MSQEPTAPSPLGGLVLTLGAWALMMFVFAVLAPSAGGTLGLALGCTLGFGAVGTLAARSVPAPADQRLGLRGFRPAWLGAVLLLLPAVVLVSEIDNRVAAALGRADATTLRGESPTDPAPGGVTFPEAADDDAGPAGEAPPAPRAGPTPADPLGALGVLGTLEWVLFAALLRPVLEEFFFRGVVQQGMVGQLGAAPGLLVTALLFAAVRASLGLGSPTLMSSLGAQALAEGLLCGLLRLATGSILPSILLQAGMAGLGVLALVAAAALAIPGFNATGAHTPAAWLFPCALSVAAGVAWLGRAAVHPALEPEEKDHV